MKTIKVRKMMVRYLLLSFLVIFFVGCNKKKDSNCLLNIPTTWVLISTDSIYYEFYFDDRQQFIFDGKYPHNLQIKNDENNKFEDFIDKITSGNNSDKIGLIVKDYFESCQIGNKPIMSVKPLGTFFYRISDDNEINNNLFARESFNRWQVFQGVISNDLPNLEDTIIIDETETFQSY